MYELLHIGFNVFLLGCVYALIGVGMSIIYGVMRVVNFAHGDFLITGAYATVFIWQKLGLDPVRSLFLVAPLFFMLGLCIYKLVIPRLLKSDDPETASFLAFFGISMMIVYGIIVVFGATPKGIPYPYENIVAASTKIGFLSLPSSRLISAFVALAIISSLIFFLYHTSWGKAIRCLIQNRNAARILGINSGQISAVSFGIGLALVASAGVLMTLVFPSVSPRLGNNYTTIAFAVIVLGGLRNPTGALFGGVLFSLAENVSGVFLPASLSSAVAFIILIVTISIRPEGILSSVKIKRSSLPQSPPGTEKAAGR